MSTEFEFLESLKHRFGLGRIGDDCAVLPKNDETDLLLTVDMLVENVDFRLAWARPEYLGHKALAVSLSDIAAMGGTPKWAMLSIAVPKHLWSGDFVDLFYNGWFALAARYDVELVGGDISRSPDKLVIDSIIGGEVKAGRAVLRSGARVGDLICVSGDLGGSSAGLDLLEKGETGDTYPSEQHQRLCLKHLKPQPKLDLANYLNKNGLATSMIDLSDGLSSDLRHICEQSAVGATIYAERVPINADLPFFDPSFEVQLELALNGGEDFELLFTTDPKNILALENENVTVIGEITGDRGKIEIVNDGKSSVLDPRGFQHF